MSRKISMFISVFLEISCRLLVLCCAWFCLCRFVRTGLMFRNSYILCFVLFIWKWISVVNPLIWRAGFNPCVLHDSPSVLVQAVWALINSLLCYWCFVYLSCRIRYPISALFRQLSGLGRDSLFDSISVYSWWSFWIPILLNNTGNGI
jgi:hypothetical protein